MLQPLCVRRRTLILFILAVCLMAAGSGWWLCDRSDNIAFLPAHSGAKWIVDATPPKSKLRRAVPNWAVFSRTFVLRGEPTGSQLSLCAFKTAIVAVNDHVVDGLACIGKNWKLPMAADVTRWLKIGTNRISVCVTNIYGPPALWLNLKDRQFSLTTDESWQVAPAGAPARHAHCASQPVVIPPWSPLYEKESTLDSVRRVWPVILLFGLVSLGLVWSTRRWLCQPGTVAQEDRQKKLVQWIFGLVLLARIALFVNDMRWLPPIMGFDAVSHEMYIRFIQDHGGLPLPSDGQEMHQAPLYYICGAAVLAVDGSSAGEDDAVIPLRAVNGVVGLTHCWLAFLCLRLLFPRDYGAQALGLVVAACVPVHLYLSLYVTNEPMAALFVTLSLYFCLRVLSSEKEDRRLYLGLGLALGAALLSKVSALLAAPLFFLAVGGRLVAQRKQFPGDWLRSVGVVVVACTVVCGWHYLRIWALCGRPVLGNWENNAGSDWVMYPGYRTGSYYYHFGVCLARPLYSGFYSFWDGIYSTLWGDGLMSGRTGMVFRPPWNYDLMNLACWLAIAPTLLALTGFAIAVGKSTRQTGWEWVLIAGLVVVYGLAILSMTLHVSSYSQVKAFYGFPALVAFSALIALGWRWLMNRSRSWGSILRIAIGTWALTSSAMFWIRDNNFEAWRGCGMVELQRHRPEEASPAFARALQLEPGDAESHCLLAECYWELNQPAEAREQFEKALRLRPNDPEILDDFATFLTGDGKEGARAVLLSKRACELTDFRQADLVGTLAAAYVGVGNPVAAMDAAQRSRSLAAQTGDVALLAKEEDLLTRLRPPN